MNKIKELRIRAGLNQAEASKILGVSTRTLQEWEKGGRTPKNIEDIENLLDAVGILTREGINSLLQNPSDIGWVLAEKKRRDAERTSRWGSNILTFQTNWERIPEVIREKLKGDELGILVDVLKETYDDGIKEGLAMV